MNATRYSVIHPETGCTVVGPATGHTVRLAHASPEVATVRISPSFRPGMPYDLATYPPSWVRPTAREQYDRPRFQPTTFFNHPSTR